MLNLSSWEFIAVTKSIRINWFNNSLLSNEIFHSDARLIDFFPCDHTVHHWELTKSKHDSERLVCIQKICPEHSRPGTSIHWVVESANGINICIFFLSFRCLSLEKKYREEWKNNTNRREHQRDEWRKKSEKSATKREKYVEINWKSIECDVKIKFIQAATSERSPWEFIL